MFANVLFFSPRIRSEGFSFNFGGLESGGKVLFATRYCSDRSRWQPPATVRNRFAMALTVVGDVLDGNMK